MVRGQTFHDLHTSDHHEVQFYLSFIPQLSWKKREYFSNGYFNVKQTKKLTLEKEIIDEKVDRDIENVLETLRKVLEKNLDGWSVMMTRKGKG